MLAFGICRRDDATCIWSRAYDVKVYANNMLLLETTGDGYVVYGCYHRHSHAEHLRERHYDVTLTRWFVIILFESAKPSYAVITFVIEPLRHYATRTSRREYITRLYTGNSDTRIVC